MLRIGKNPRDSDKTQVAAEGQEKAEAGARPETDNTTTAADSEAKGLLDSTGGRIRAYQPRGMFIEGEDYEAMPGLITRAYGAPASELEEEVFALAIPHKEFERLSAKTNEVLTEAALAQERISKDQQEIEQLKMETRAMLGKLRAA